MLVPPEAVPEAVPGTAVNFTEKTAGDQTQPPTRGKKRRGKAPSERFEPGVRCCMRQDLCTRPLAVDEFLQCLIQAFFYEIATSRCLLCGMRGLKNGVRLTYPGWE